MSLAAVRYAAAAPCRAVIRSSPWRPPLRSDSPAFPTRWVARRGLATISAHAEPAPAASSTPPSIDIEDLANKARLRLNAEEVTEFQESVARIVDWFGQLGEANVDDVEPAIHAAVFSKAGLENLREDRPAEFGDREAMLAEAPSREGKYLKVPRILGGDASTE